MTGDQDSKKPGANTGGMAQNPMAAAMEGMAARIMRETVTFQAEMLQFITQRVNADMEASAKFWSSKSPEEAAETVRSYYEKALQDYTSQATAMVEAATSIAADAVREGGWQQEAPDGERHKSLNTKG